MIDILTRTPQDTEAWGAKLARALPQIDRAAVVYLTGDLGAGKTTLARGFIQGSGVSGAVRSPTYTLLETYTATNRSIVHLDLYRLRSPEEIEPLGLRDYLRVGHVLLIEWPDQGSGHLPPADLYVELRTTTQGHKITANGLTDLGRQWLQGVELPAPHA